MKTKAGRDGHSIIRLVVTLLLVGGLGSIAWIGTSSSASGPVPVPRARCGPGSLPETSTQGRVPKADYTSGRAAKGYRCNARQVAHTGRSGGAKVIRYVDTHGRVCAFYDYSLTFPRDLIGNTLSGAPTGVQVLSMANPARPVHTDTLVTPAMQQPHESLLMNNRRGLLAAVMGSAATAPGIVDIYDASADCRHPKLMSTTPLGIVGHESGFSPDGKTFYATSTALNLMALDVSNPLLPKPLVDQVGVNYHGLRLSDDGKTMYAANFGTPGLGGITGGGLRILDVSQVQARVKNPQIKTLSSLSWPQMSIPQVAEPFTRNGRKYVLEVDEFVDLFSLKGLATSLTTSPVGAARIIDVQDPRHPRLVSNIRLKVHQPDQRTGPQRNDPGASLPSQGYAGHYCSMPRRVNPNLAACSMIASGLRIFDIRDVRHPREVAYFNRPVVKAPMVTVPPVEGAYAMSQPAWDVRHKSIWYSDANSGFYVVQLTNGIGKLL